MRLGLLVSTIIWATLAVYLTGCGGSSGWRVSFGVSPVTQIDDQQSLKQVEDKK
jgi:hypothetical protein